MKVFLAFFLIFQVSFASSSYVLSYVAKLYGHIKFVDFDPDGNTYALQVTSNSPPSYVLYKLSREREILSKNNLGPDVDGVDYMHVTSKGDAYFFIYINSFQPRLAILRSNSDTLEIREEIKNRLFYLDPYDNLYYGKATGLNILRPGSNTSVQIENLENLSVVPPETTTVDNEGNIYFATKDDITLKYSLALISKEELQNEVPKAKILKVFDSYVSDIVVDERNSVWIAIPGRTTKGYVAYIEKLTNGTFETIKTDLNHTDCDLTAAKDRIWVVAAGHKGETAKPSIYYVTLDNEVVDIPKLQNLTEQFVFQSQSLADRDGRAYIMTTEEFAELLGSMIVINPGETKPTRVRFNTTDVLNIRVDYIAMDINEDVWITVDKGQTGGITLQYLYFLKKGETTANEIPKSSGFSFRIHSNPITKDIFVACLSGLFLAVNEE